MCQEHECVICLDSIKSGDEYQTPCCNQHFHKKCLEKWTISQNSKLKSCPHCREDLNCLNPIKIKNFNRSNILDNFNFSLNINLSGNKYLISNIKKLPSAVVQNKINIGGTKKTIPIYVFDSEIKNLDNNFTINYFISLTTIYACLKKISDKFVCKPVINYAFIDALIPDNHDFYNYISSYNKDLSDYHNYQSLINIIN